VLKRNPATRGKLVEGGLRRENSGLRERSTEEKAKRDSRALAREVTTDTSVQSSNATRRKIGEPESGHHVRLMVWLVESEIKGIDAKGSERSNLLFSPLWIKGGLLKPGKQ